MSPKSLHDHYESAQRNMWSLPKHDCGPNDCPQTGSQMTAHRQYYREPDGCIQTVLPGARWLPTDSATESQMTAYRQYYREQDDSIQTVLLGEQDDCPHTVLLGARRLPKTILLEARWRLLNSPTGNQMTAPRQCYWEQNDCPNRANLFTGQMTGYRNSTGDKLLQTTVVEVK